MIDVIVVSIISLISKITGLFRELSLSYVYGASSITDIYLISITITTAITGFITPAINASYIPYANQIESTEGKGAMVEYTRSFLYVLMMISLALIFCGEIFTQQIVKLFAGGFSEEQLANCCRFAKFTLIAICPLLLISVTSGYLQNHNKAVLVSFVPVIENIVVIISILASAKIGLTILPVGYLVAATVAFLPLMVGTMNSGLSYVGRLSIYSRKIDTFKTMIPVVIGASATQINTMVDRTIASSLEEGSISVLYYADRIVGIIIGIVVLAPLTVMFPKLSKLALKKDCEVYGSSVKHLFLLLSVICIFGMSCIFFFNTEIVKVLFERGQFDENAVRLTGLVLQIYSIGLLGYALREYLTRVYYAENNYKTPFINSLVSVAANIVLDFVFRRVWGTAGLALATVVSAYLAVIMMIFSRRRNKTEIFDWNNMTSVFFTIVSPTVFWIGCKRIIHSETIWTTAIEMIIGCIIFCVAFLIFKPCDIKIIRKILKDEHD